MTGPGVDVALVVGCAAGGLVVGALLGAMAGKVAPAPAFALDPLTEPPPVDGPVAFPPPSEPSLARVAGPTSGAGAVTPVVLPVSAEPPALVDSRPLSRVALGAASLVTGALFGAAALHFGSAPELAAYCVLFAALVALSLVDLRVGLVPRRMLYPLSAVMVVALIAASASQGDWRALRDAAIGGLAAFTVLFAVWWVHPRGMGLGDVRLAAMIGAALGWLGLLHVYVGFVVGFLAGALFGIAVMVARGTGRKTKLPFAPALAVGAVVGVLWGSSLVNVWLPGHG